MTDDDNAAAIYSTIDGTPRVWRQASLHGAPCFAGHYEDVSRRTVDFRTPRSERGHYHPRRILVFKPPPVGWFPSDMTTVNWDNPNGTLFQNNIEIDKSVDGLTVYRNRQAEGDEFHPVTLRRVIELGVGGGGDPDFHTYRFEGFVLDNRVVLHAGRLQLARCAARTVEVLSNDLTDPVLTATDCLLNDVDATTGSLLRLEYCTVLENFMSGALQASDCIFVNLIRANGADFEPPSAGCIRFSRVHPEQGLGDLAAHANSTDPVVFIADRFGDRACATLHQQTADSVRFGAEDGGEMGAYHIARHTLAEHGLLDKLDEFLPVGMEAVLVSDARLLETPTTL